MQNCQVSGGEKKSVEEKVLLFSGIYADIYLVGFDKKIEIFDSSWLNEFDVSTFVPERTGYTFTGWKTIQ